MSKKFEQAADKLLKVSRKLIAAGETAGCLSAEESIDKLYPNRLQDQVNTLRVLQNRHNQVNQVKSQPVYKNKAAIDSAIFIIEQNLCSSKQTLVSLIESVEASNVSDLDVVVLLSNDLEEAGCAFLAQAMHFMTHINGSVMHAQKNRKSQYIMIRFRA